MLSGKAMLFGGENTGYIKLCAIGDRRGNVAALRLIWRDYPMSTVKEELTGLILRQPEDSSREEIVRELAFHVMVERGVADSDARRVISNEEMAKRIRSWER